MTFPLPMWTITSLPMLLVLSVADCRHMKGKVIAWTWIQDYNRIIVFRHTYRYTPLLAWMLMPTATFAPFGKIVFIIFDVLSGALILSKSGKAAAGFYLFNPLTIGIAIRGNAEPVM